MGQAFDGTSPSWPGHADLDLGEYSASVSWGDGTQATASLSFEEGTFTVGQHTWDMEGSGQVQVFLYDSQGLAQAFTPLEVSSRTLTVEVSPISMTEGGTFSGAVATLSDGNTTTGTPPFEAMIDWGDGTVNLGTVVQVEGQSYEVLGTHYYAEAGSYLPHVRVTDGPPAWPGILRGVTS